MKSLIALSLLVSATAMAASKTEVQQTTQTIRVDDLHCRIAIIPAVPVEERTLTEISSSFHTRSFLLSPKNIILKHTYPGGQGCLIPQLDSIVEDSRKSFGFRYGVPVEVTRITQDAIRTNDGACVARVQEILKIELDKDITLTSEKIDLVPSTDCK